MRYSIAMSSKPASWDPNLYQSRHAFVWELAKGPLELLAAKAGERVLDLGCGPGQLTAQIAAVGVDVVGLDRSEEMIAQARRNYPQLQFEVADARTFNVDRPFDAVFSNAVLHWVRPAAAAIERIWQALQPGGRFVAEFGGYGNVRHICDAIAAGLLAQGGPTFEAISPWYYPTIGEYAGELERRGFDVTFAKLFDRPTPLEGETGMRDWLRMFAGVFVEQVPPDRRETFIGEIERRLRPTLYYDGRWHADYRRLRVVAHKPADSTE
jgi:trans-aconitate 2-methyltransferase